MLDVCVVNHGDESVYDDGGGGDAVLSTNKKSVPGVSIHRHIYS